MCSLCRIIGLLQPSNDLVVDISEDSQLDPVREHRVEAARGFQAPGRRALKDQPHIHLRGRAGLQQGKLPAPPDADFGLFRRELHVRAEHGDPFRQPIMERPQSCLSGEQMRDRIVAGPRRGRLRSALGNVIGVRMGKAVFPKWVTRQAPTVDLLDLKRAAQSRRVLRIAYETLNGTASTRRVRPLSVTFFGPVWLLVAWCETAADFRCFRLDRIRMMEPTGETFRDETGKRLIDFKRVKGEQAAASAAV
jgi:hypothetical protein